MTKSLFSVARLHPPAADLSIERRSVGFLTDSFTDFYQLSLLTGAARASQDRQAHFFAFAGGVPTTTVPDGSCLETSRVQALVATAATMGYVIGADGLATYCRALCDGPLCFLGARAPQTASVMPDSSRLWSNISTSSGSPAPTSPCVTLPTPLGSCSPTTAHSRAQR